MSDTYSDFGFGPIASTAVDIHPRPVKRHKSHRWHSKSHHFEITFEQIHVWLQHEELVSCRARKSGPTQLVVSNNNILQQVSWMFHQPKETGNESQLPATCVASECTDDSFEDVLPGLMLET